MLVIVVTLQIRDSNKVMLLVVVVQL